MKDKQNQCYPVIIQLRALEIDKSKTFCVFFRASHSNQGLSLQLPKTNRLLLGLESFWIPSGGCSAPLIVHKQPLKRLSYGKVPRCLKLCGVTITLSFSVWRFTTENLKNAVFLSTGFKLSVIGSLLQIISSLYTLEHILQLKLKTRLNNYFIFILIQ